MKDYIQTETEADAVLHAVFNTVRQGKISEDIRKTQYLKIFEELLVMDNILVKGKRLVIFRKLTNRKIKLSHELYGLGEQKMIQYLRTKVWFPNMAAEVRRYNQDCYPCMSQQNLKYFCLQYFSSYGICEW